MYQVNLFDRNIWLLASSMAMARIFPVRLDQHEAAIVLNKDGSLQMTFRYRGPDLDSATSEECEIATRRLSELVSSMKTGRVLYFEAQHIPATAYPSGIRFPEPLSAAMDGERRRLFSSGIYFESRFYVTLYWMPPKDSLGRLKKMVLDGQERKEVTSEDIMADFIAEATKLFLSFKSIGVPAYCLTPDETLSYLHSCVSGETERCIFQSTRCFLTTIYMTRRFRLGLNRFSENAINELSRRSNIRKKRLLGCSISSIAWIFLTVG